MAFGVCFERCCQNVLCAGDVTSFAPQLRLASPRVLEYGMEVRMLEAA